jgi:hypothetical protein
VRTPGWAIRGRSDYVFQVPSPWRGGLVESLGRGYRDSERPASPAWKLARILTLLRVIGQQRRRVGSRKVRYWRAMAELRRLGRSWWL